MIFKYALFELKLLLRNKKNWLLGSVLILFFPIFFTYHSESSPETIRDIKIQEGKELQNIVDSYPAFLREQHPKAEEIYQLIIQQTSLVNYQRYYLWLGEDEYWDEYIENGLKLNELRLKVHELGNLSIPEHVIVPKEEIAKEMAFYSYLKEHQLPIVSDPLTASTVIPKAFDILSGMMFYIFILLWGADIYLTEVKHRSLTIGFPLSYLTKVNIKVATNTVYFLIVLLISIGIGTLYISSKSSVGYFNYPTLIYLAGEMVAIPTFQYLLLAGILMTAITLFTFYLSIFLNILLKTSYGSVIVGLSVVAIPYLLYSTGITPLFIQPFLSIDFSNILNGNLAITLNNPMIDIWFALIWLFFFTLIIFMISYLKNKRKFHSYKATALINQEQVN